MPVPTPNSGESQNDFMQRCMRWMHDNDAQRPNAQMVAVCMRTWTDKGDTGKFDSTRRHMRQQVDTFRGDSNA